MQAIKKKKKDTPASCYYKGYKCYTKKDKTRNYFQSIKEIKGKKLIEERNHGKILENTAWLCH